MQALLIIQQNYITDSNNIGNLKLLGYLMIDTRFEQAFKTVNFFFSDQSFHYLLSQFNS